MGAEAGPGAAAASAPQAATAQRHVRVLQSFATPGPTTNPHLVLLLRALREQGADVRPFSWRRALTWRYDVLHVHWPEVVVTKTSRPRTWAAVALLALTLVRCRLRRTAVVRTAHNLAPHERQPAATRAVLRLCERWTTWWITLNPTTPTPPGAHATTVPLGDYGTWYAEHPLPAPVPGRLLHFGIVRPYKGVLELLDAFRGVHDDGLTLRIAGRPGSPATAREVAAGADGDPRVTVRLHHLDDADLVAEIGAAGLVVLPYRAMHNSGALLLALTLGRPVLVPANDVTDALADEVGPWWVQRFEGVLTADALRRAVDATRTAPSSGPDLSARDWGTLAASHLGVYRDAVRAARGARA